MTCPLSTADLINKTLNILFFFLFSYRIKKMEGGTDEGRELLLLLQKKINIFSKKINLTLL